ncbi:hypothetical protein, partial [Ralstonia pseudosolanacearum]
MTALRGHPHERPIPLRRLKTARDIEKKAQHPLGLRLLTNPTFFGVWGFVFYAKRILGRRESNRPEGVE